VFAVYFIGLLVRDAFHPRRQKPPAWPGNVAQTALSAVSPTAWSAGKTTQPDAAQMDLYACEEVLTAATENFVEAGLALGPNPRPRLYRIEFQSFEAYCRAKWRTHESTLTISSVRPKSSRIC